MIDERGASWKVLLPCKPEAILLALGLNLGQLVSLARSWSRVDHDFYYDREVQSAVPKRLLSRLTLLDISDAAYEGKTYDVIVLGNLRTFDLSTIKKLFYYNLSDHGVMVFAGDPNCKLSSLILKKNDVVLKKYAVLPLDSPRIIFPLSGRVLRRKGLLFHQPGSWSSQLGVLASTWLSSFGWVSHLEKNAVSLVYKDTDHMGYSLRNWLSDRSGRQFEELIIYCGSDTDRRKMTALAITKSKEDLVVKIADSLLGKKALIRESQALKALSSMGKRGLCLPELILEDEWAGYFIQVQTSVPKKSKSQTRQLTRRHVDFLVELARMGRRSIVFSETSCCKEILYLSSQIDNDIPEVLQRIISKMLSPTFQKGTVICHRMHGDFAPWNINVSRKKISIWDWEDSLDDGLVYTDIFHFIIRQAILVGPWPGVKKVLKEIKKNCLQYQNLAGLPVNCDYSSYLSIWIIWEYLKNPHDHIIEIASFLEIEYG